MKGLKTYAKDGVVPFTGVWTEILYVKNREFIIVFQSTFLHLKLTRLNGLNR